MVFSSINSAIMDGSIDFIYDGQTYFLTIINNNL